MKINVSHFKCQSGISFPEVYKIEVHFTSDKTCNLCGGWYLVNVVILEVVPSTCY